MRLMTLTITTITTNKRKMEEVEKEKKHSMSSYFSPGTSLSALYLIFTITK